LEIPGYDSPGAKSGGGGPNSELSEARVRGSNQPKKNTSERREQEREPGTRGTRCGSAAEAMNQPDGQAGEPDGQRNLKRGTVAKRVIEPRTDPLKTAGVKIMSVGAAASGLNAEGVPPGGGERHLPGNRESKNGGGKKRIAAQDNRARQPRKQEHG